MWMLTGTKLTPRSNGNAYWENYEEQPGRQRWVDFKQPDYDSTQILSLIHI